MTILNNNIVKLSDIMPKLGKFVKVRNANSLRGNGVAKNQFIIEFQNGEVFQSYNSICGAWHDCTFYFTDKHDYSTTTSKYMKAWCRYSAKERRKGLDKGTFKHLTMD